MKKEVWMRFEEHMKQAIGIYIFVSTLLLMGVVFGAIIVNSLHMNQKEDLLYELQRFLGQVDAGKMIQQDTFFNAYMGHVLYLLFIWILGISMVGLPVIFLLIFLKGITIGFTVGFFVNQLGLKGFYLAIVSVLPQNIIIVPAIIISSSVAILFSIRLIKQLFIRNDYKRIRTAFLRYSFSFFMIMFVIVIPTLIEVYLSPFAIEGVLSIK